MSNVEPKFFNHTYAVGDVTLHMDAGEVELVSVAQKETRLARGEHYGHLLTPEAPPDALQRQLFITLLEQSAPRLAGQIFALAAQLHAAHGAYITLVSLVRAGLPIGVLLMRQLQRLGVDVSHHGVSVIRGHGIDRAALGEVTQQRGTRHIVFVDGWTGKGSIRAELEQSLTGGSVAFELLVVCDPAGVADVQATFADEQLPHAVLNATVSGLLSRSFLHTAGLRHAARFEASLLEHDLSRYYVDAVDAHLLNDTLMPSAALGTRPLEAASRALELARLHGARDANRIKASLGESWRALLRRRTRALLLGPDHPEQWAISTFAQSKGVPVIRFTESLPYHCLALLEENR